MILPYIIKSAMALALLYTCIIPLLEKETFHRLNRILILGCLIMSFAIPLVHFTGGTNPTVDMVRQAVQLPEVLINGNASEQSVWSWADIMTCIYIIGVVCHLTGQCWVTHLHSHFHVSAAAGSSQAPEAPHRPWQTPSQHLF